MKTKNETLPRDDEFELIELGSVSEETKGDIELPNEGVLRPFSRVE